jgi:hypothetical protein
MSKDLIERLRYLRGIGDEAADRIEQLEAENERLVRAWEAMQTAKAKSVASEKEMFAELAALKAQAQEPVGILHCDEQGRSRFEFLSVKLPAGSHNVFTAPPPSAEAAKDALIERMASNFLGWKLPKDFNPDAGIAFDREYGEKWGMPVGTNLLTLDQARAMFEYCYTARGEGK